MHQHIVSSRNANAQRRAKMTLTSTDAALSTQSTTSCRYEKKKKNDERISRDENNRRRSVTTNATFAIQMLTKRNNNAFFETQTHRLHHHYSNFTFPFVRRFSLSFCSAFDANTRHTHSGKYARLMR